MSSFADAGQQHQNGVGGTRNSSLLEHFNLSPGIKQIAADILEKNARHQNDPRPLDASCQCPACKNYSRAYLHHVFKSQEIISSMLITWHNLHYYQELMEKMRKAILNQSFSDFELDFNENLSLGDLDPI